MSIRFQIVLRIRNVKPQTKGQSFLFRIFSKTGIQDVPGICLFSYILLQLSHSNEIRGSHRAWAPCGEIFLFLQLFTAKTAETLCKPLDIRISDLQSNAKSINGFQRWDISFRLFITIWKTVLKNSGLARARIISKKKTAVHENSFSNPFSDFPIERWKGNQWNPDLDFLIEIQPEDGFLVRLQNLKSGFQNLNPDFPIERKPKYLCTYQRPSWEVDIREPPGICTKNSKFTNWIPLFQEQSFSTKSYHRPDPPHLNFRQIAIKKWSS